MVEQPLILPSSYFSNSSSLLDLAASDDLAAFKLAVDSGLQLNAPGLWYSRRLRSRSMAFEHRTPLMIAALFGSTNVLRYILSASAPSDINLASSSDGATALHLAASTGEAAAIQILLASSANPNAVTSSGETPADLIPKSKNLRSILASEDPDSPKSSSPSPSSPDRGAPLPDINVGVYGSDEFRMYGFKIKPCSRAYTHDWTECPFAHPGENARRRDPLRHQYSCVPCPEFKKGSCRKGDACEYAHGVFESWLHPAQYRTRLCKDETGCNRKVCFFAHRKNELRPVFASTGSAIESMDSASSSSSPGSPKWPGAGKAINCPTPPPALQLGGGGSRLRSSSSASARNVELEMELFRLETQISQQKQQRKMIDEVVYGRSFSDLKPASLESVFGLNSNSNSNSPVSLSHLRSSYPSRKLSPTELDRSPKSVAAAMLNSRAAAAFAKRSQSFIDRGSNGSQPMGGQIYLNGSANLAPSWGSGDGRADWSVQEGDLSKMRRSVSFGQRGGNMRGGYGGAVVGMREPVPAPPCSAWVDQMYIEQEQMVA